MEWSKITVCQYFVLVVAFWTRLTLESKPGYKTYEGDKILTVQVPDMQTWNIVQRILTDDVTVHDVDIWKHPDFSKRPTADIHVTSVDYAKVSSGFRRNGIRFESKIEDLGKLVQAEHNNILNTSNARQKRDSESKYDIVGVYPTYHEILGWMRHMAEMYPSLVDVVHIGQTYEDRKMMAIKIGIPGQNKSSIWLDAGIHSREYISVTTAIYTADQLIQGYMQGDRQIVWYLESFDFYILPVVNPDGFVYCHEKDRLWRKNRRPTSDPECVGVDLNRNWDIKWGRAISDKEPCSISYRGPSAASEPEVQNMAKFLLDKDKRFIGYISFHSYSQWFFTRYSYDFVFPSDHDELLRVADDAVNAMLLVHYTVYVSGTSPVLMYPYSGGSPDWAKDKANVTYSYLLELRDRGRRGFLLPQEEIIPTGEEVWAGMKVVFDAAGERFGKPYSGGGFRDPVQAKAISGSDVGCRASIWTIVALLCVWLVYRDHVGVR